MLLKNVITPVDESDKLIDDAVIALNDAIILDDVSANVMLDAVIVLCDCIERDNWSSNETTPPLDVSNNTVSNNTSSKRVFDTVMSTRYCSLVSYTTGSNLLFVLSNNDVVVTLNQYQPSMLAAPKHYYVECMICEYLIHQIQFHLEC